MNNDESTDNNLLASKLHYAKAYLEAKAIFKNTK